MSPNRMTFELAQFGSASRSIARFLGEVTAAELARPSPCCGWDGRQVVNHMVGTAHLLAAAARGESPSMPDWDTAPDLLGDDPEAVYVMAAGAVAMAFGKASVLENQLALPFARPTGRAALQVVTADHVTHAWDLARCTGRPVVLDDAVVAMALETAHAAISPELRSAGWYGGETTAPRGAPALDRLAAFTGRPV